MKTTTLAEAFAFFGTFPDNPRWSWSAVSPDLKSVAVTIWETEVGADGSIDVFGNPGLADWTSKPGNRERIRNLKLARENCGGLFHVIWVTARDLNENPWTIAGRYPEEHFMMKLVELDEVTGEFSAVLVDPASEDHERRAMADRPNKPPAHRSPTPSGRRRTTPQKAQRATPTCLTCFMELPATGVCDTCG
ncbi:hypothetical protein WBG06_26405 [Nocardioides sp. CCNWLW239]|uniref:hypothetical protein n=1 Tax=Nocardioides sp. CCNWLW239 TaxID=3128902 RepID=UPI003017D76D